MDCSTPTPTPTPTPPSGSGSGSILPGLPDLPVPGLGGGGVTPDSSSSPSPSAKWGKAKTVGGTPTFTLPAAQLGGSSISIAGLQSVGLVKVPLANGKSATVIRLVADNVAVSDFVLDVRKATGPSLVTTSTRMELRGHVQVYLDSLTATLPGGLPLTLGASTPPPGEELPSQLLGVHLGLVGVTASSITFADAHQLIHE